MSKEQNHEPKKNSLENLDLNAIELNLPLPEETPPPKPIEAPALLAPTPPPAPMPTPQVVAPTPPPALEQTQTLKFPDGIDAPELLGRATPPPPPAVVTSEPLLKAKKGSLMEGLLGSLGAPIATDNTPEPTPPSPLILELDIPTPTPTPSSTPMPTPQVAATPTATPNDPPSPPPESEPINPETVSEEVITSSDPFPVHWEESQEILIDDIDRELKPELFKKSAASVEKNDKDAASEEEAISTIDIVVHRKEKSPETAEKKPKLLGERLVEKGLISEDQLKIALKEQAHQSEKSGDKAMLGAILVSMGFITESALGAVLAETTGVQHFDIMSAALDAQLLKKIPKDVAIRYKVLPVSQEGNSVLVATPDVYNILALDQIHKYFPNNYKITLVYSPESDLMETIEHYHGYEMSVDGILKEIETGIKDETLSGEEEGYTNPTVRLVDALLIDAIKKGASDIHFEPEGFFLRLRYRIDGQMMQIRSFHKDYWPAISVRIKIMSHMNIAETRAPQDGRISYNVLGREIDFRVATQPTVHGENIVMRILDKRKSLVPMEQLGYSERNIKLLKRLLKRPEGIIIVTGPTGSGKTTSLYSMLSYINSIDVNIMTLEDPVEYQLPLIRQSQVREGGAMDFVNGIKSLMRQDPDIIFVGEIRDEPTANMAVRAAMTGHQVFSTLHTNDALGAIPRLVDIGIPPHLLAGSLTACVAQRLGRTLCNACKEAYTPSPEECKILGIPPENPPTIYRHIGCEKCGGSGYKGRVSIVEILPVDKEFDDLISMGATRRTMIEHATQHGFVSMADDGIEKIFEGIMDIEELIRTIDMTSRLE